MISESEKLETEASANKSREETIQSDDLLWGDFDRRNSAAMSNETPRSNAVWRCANIYKNHLFFERTTHLLGGRADKTSIYICLNFAETHLCMMATSVPSERIFSKCGQLISERRSRLKPKNVEMVIFLHANYKLFK